MRIIRGDQLAAALSSAPPNPRVVVSGNFATPLATLRILDSLLPEYVLHALHAQKGIPTRPGVVHETAFVGPGMRHSPTLRYVPCRLSLEHQAQCPARWLWSRHRHLELRCVPAWLVWQGWSDSWSLIWTGAVSILALT